MNFNDFHRDTWAEIDLSAIYENVAQVKALYKNKNVQMMAVVKANGYGHGAVQVAETALKAGATHLAVALLDEAIELRQAGIVAPILVLGRIRPEDVELAAELNVIVTVFQVDWLQEAKKLLPEGSCIQIHLKFDTGMGRVGLRNKEEVKGLVSVIKENSAFVVNGVYTHFATADELDSSYVEEQYQRFTVMLEWLEELDLQVPIIHCGNSATSLRYPEKVFNMFRLGISMYGLAPSPEIKDHLPVRLKPAFSLKTRLVQVKQVEEGEAISYGATYRTLECEWIGTLPIGYADGWLRYHSQEKGEVLVSGKRAPFVGRICMDQCMIKLPGEVPVGTIVTLIGKDGSDEVSIDEIATRLQTINYEIPCIISNRVPRVYKWSESVS